MKQGWSPITYYPELDSLDDVAAGFVANSGTDEFFQVVIPRKHWEQMGRPGKVYYEPKPWPVPASSDSGAGA